MEENQNPGTTSFTGNQQPQYQPNQYQPNQYQPNQYQQPPASSYPSQQAA